MRYVKGLPVYNIAAPSCMVLLAFMVHFSTIGAIRLQNKEILNPATQMSAAGYASNIYFDRIDNFGERAFFASFSLVLQGCLGIVSLMALRKYWNVDMSTAMVLKYVCRGAAAGVLATMFIEFIHLPFQDNLSQNDNLVSRIFLVLFVVVFIAVIEEAAKLGGMVLGLKREMPAPGSEETGIMRYLTAVLESPHSLALAGLAAGVGFAFIENIPRLLSIAADPPLVMVQESYMGESEQLYMAEEDQRSVRVWVFFVWVLVNIQPFLSGLAAFKLAEHTGGAKILTPQGVVEVLKVPLLLHFLHDLLARSTSTWVLILSFAFAPLSVYLFRKEWLANAADGQSHGLLQEREDSA